MLKAKYSAKLYSVPRHAQKMTGFLKALAPQLKSGNRRLNVVFPSTASDLMGGRQGVDATES